MMPEKKSSARASPQLIRLAFKQSAIHGIGGFATEDISRGSRVIEYIGERIDQWESLRRCEGNNQYIFMLTEKEHLDGNVPWNPARFINHSCEPNCQTEME